MLAYKDFITEAKGPGIRLIDKFKELHDRGHGGGEGHTFVGNSKEHTGTIEKLKMHGLIKPKHTVGGGWAVLHHTPEGEKALRSNKPSKDNSSWHEIGRDFMPTTPYG